MTNRTSSSLAGEYVTIEPIFQDGLRIDEDRYSSTWLTDLPDLAEECRTKFVASVVGETVAVGGEVFRVGIETFEDVGQFITPKRVSRKFPLKRGPGRISRVLLRREFIKRWNKHIESLDAKVPNLPSKNVILSAAGGLGKSIYLYLFAIFAKQCKIPLQYIANTSVWLYSEDISKIVSLYLKMLLFMNADILDNIPNLMCSRYLDLCNVPLKKVIYFAMRTKNISLAIAIRDFMTELEPRNFLIVDGHEAFWRRFGTQTISWPSFARAYADIRKIITDFCGVLITDSPHYEFDDSLPSGYEVPKDYVEPLNFEEFQLWQDLSVYPLILRRHPQEVIELTGLVPRMIAKMVFMIKKYPGIGFEELVYDFIEDNYARMKVKHNRYVMSLKKKVKRNHFVKMLLLLFLGEDTPEVSISDAAYLNRGLLIIMRDGTLRFCNTIARDVLFDAFSSYFLTSDSLEKLSEKFKDSPGTVQCLHFEQNFFLWCLYKCSSWELYLPRHHRTIKFESNKWIRLDRMQFNPFVPKITNTCWVKISELGPKLDFAYVHVRDGRWNLYLVQASISSFPDHNRGSSNIELLFEPSERPQLTSLLNLFFGQADLQLSTVRDESNKVVNFEVTDSNGNSFRHRIYILYITPKTREEARVSEAPSYVECITLEDLSEDCKRYLGLQRTGEVERRRH